MYYFFTAFTTTKINAFTITHKAFILKISVVVSIPYAAITSSKN